MAGGVVWDATAVSRAITILNYSSENVASHTLTPPSNAGSNEAALATQVERINRVIEKGFLLFFYYRSWSDRRIRGFCKHR